jgi:hypothetical protein
MYLYKSIKRRILLLGTRGINTDDITSKFTAEIEIFNGYIPPVQVSIWKMHP